MLVAAALLGAHVAWLQIGASLPILALVIAAHLPFAIATAAMVLAFRSRGPLPQLVLIASGFLGGVYYPTTVIPGWIQSVADFVPLAYGLRALRAVLLEGNSLLSVWRDVLVLVGWSAVSLALSAIAFRAALRYARRVGNLAQY
jgi:ABC-2 type transport system permease protein